ncbi:MAG: hypothetical protein AAFO77_05935 [Pseudomonadota bacterium]
MTKKAKSLFSCLFAGSLALTLLPSEAAAQSMSPMRGKVNSFTDSFALKVMPANPYDHRIRIEVKVYDQNFRPVRDARVSPHNFTLAGQFARPVTVTVPFNGNKERRIRVCTESVPFPGQAQSNIKAQVCGKFIGTRVN